MNSKVLLQTDRKGSNPGGKCYFESGRLGFLGYLKYCFGSKIKGICPFVPEHQPIYEAITFELAKKLGLKTTNAYVLLNPEQDVIFEGWREVGETDPSGRTYYFISSWQYQPTAREKNGNGERYIIPITHYPYLESVLIADVIGRKQNYLINPSISEDVVYLDLGCSFVHAHGGFIEQPNRMKLNSRKEIKRASKRLRDKAIIDATGQNLINLEELAEFPYNMSITTLNPWNQRLVRDFLTPDELAEITSHLVQAVLRTIPQFRQAGVLIE